MYTVRYRRELDLLDITWSGLFTPEEMIDYAEECRACHRRERFREGYRLRIVLDDDRPLPQATLEILSGVFTDYPKAARIAMVTRSQLCRLQIKRAMMEPHMQIFETSEAALEWLLTPTTNI